MLIFVNSICFPETDNNTSGIFVYEQCKVLLELGHQIVVLYPTYKSIKDPNRLKKECVMHSKYNEFDVYKLKYLFIAQTKAPILSALIYSRNLRKCYNKAVEKYGKPDIIYSHFSLNAGYGAVCIGKRYNIPVVTLEHYSGFINGKINKRTKILLRKVIKNSSEFLCVSDHLRKDIVRLTDTKKQILVLPNMVNSIFKYTEKDNHDTFVFFTVGGLIKRKNFNLLIKLFCKAFSKNEKVRLLIAGEGEEKNNLNNLIDKTFNRKEQIKLCGSMDRMTLFEEYKKCDAFVLLSEKETFGIVYREAMCVGRPIISSKNGGIECNWEDEFGILVNISDENEIINALKTMKKNISNYNSKYISLKTTELYSCSKIGKQIEEILKKSIKKAGNK